jgi:hypothetical protein
MNKPTTCLDIVNKANISIKILSDIYGKEGEQRAMEILDENKDVFKTLRENEALQQISQKLGDINLANTFYNYHIENKFKDEIIQNQLEELEILNEENIILHKTIKENKLNDKNLNKQLNELRNKQIQNYSSSNRTSLRRF